MIPKEKFNLALVLFLATIFSFGGSEAFGEKNVNLIKIEGIINSVASEFIKNSIEKAEESGAECLIVQMDTPGGLMKSMRSIVKEIFASQVPVAVYVHPAGARAASAGVFITMSAHVAAMTPGTNIGAAHPVTMGGGTPDTVMAGKITNDAAAYIRSIAKKRSRNAQWAEQSVRKSVSITAKEALKANVIDFVCETPQELLEKMDGMEVELSSGTKVISTKDAKIKKIPVSFRYRILDKISDPNLAYILLLIGIYGIIFELANPGAIFPGVVGAMSLLLAFFALQTLPINYTGLLLILLAIGLFIAETQIPSYGLLSVGGAASMALGSIMLFDIQIPSLKLSLKVIIPAVGITTAFFLLAIGMGLSAQRKKPVTGIQGLIGQKGETTSEVNPEGKVNLNGEIWIAKSNEKIGKGERVVVINVDGLKLEVSKVKESS